MPCDGWNTKVSTFFFPFRIQIVLTSLCLSRALVCSLSVQLQTSSSSAEVQLGDPWLQYMRGQCGEQLMFFHTFKQ